MNIFIFFKKYLKKELVLQCIEYYENNDIFLNTNSDYYFLKENLLNKKRISYLDINSFIKKTCKSEFSFFRKFNPYIYKLYHSKKDNINIQYNYDLKNSIFVKPNFQDNLAYKKLLQLINKNEDKKYLIIDLRHSMGGSVKNCASLCDILLPPCDIFTQKFKNKKVTYISNENYKKFKMIFILVDKYTASSSEIFAYALSMNLKNCKLIGYKTYGKFVGQDIITNKKEGFILSTVSFSWHIDKFSYENVKIIKPINNDYLSMVEKEIINNEKYK